ncbi:MAG: pyridoxal phosphate-dependent aminotransferase [Peptostreptococcaceae bacterium]|nr:pyridoxal phosphate-dependent aminotransferase [Peptostreptococcaceae bacterium]
MLANIVNKITPSCTVGINAKVQELKKQGNDIINFSIGEPDFFTPDIVKESAIKAIRENKTKYDKVSGVIELRQAIVEKLQRENQLSYKTDEIVVSNGAKQSITNICIAILNLGDEVIIPAPYWVSYPEIVRITGGVPVIAMTKRNNDFKITGIELESLITDKTKMLIITNPSNPLGTVYSKAELEDIVAVCVRKGIYILSDEIYERICFANEYNSIASISEEAKKITITVNGLSKSSAMTGWRIGYTASSIEIAQAMSSIQGHLTSHPSTISQWASVMALNEGASFTRDMVEVYHQRRDAAVEILKSMPQLSFIYPMGAFYIFIDISSFHHKFPDANSFSVAFCEQLLEKAGVAVVPGKDFGADDFMRISYACEMEVLIEGLSRIKKFIENL